MISGQTTGYIVIDGKKILVLARATYTKKYHYGYTSLKIREGENRRHFGLKAKATLGAQVHVHREQ